MVDSPAPPGVVLANQRGERDGALYHPVGAPSSARLLQQLAGHSDGATDPTVVSREVAGGEVAGGSSRHTGRPTFDFLG